MVNIGRHALVIMSKKTDKVKTVVYAYGQAQLSMYALTKLKGSEYALLVELKDGSIKYVFEGNKNGYPTRHDADENVVVEDSCLQMIIRDDPYLEDKDETTT